MTRSKCVVQIDGQVIPQRAYFCYLESIIHQDGEIEEDVIYSIKEGWLKWGSAYSIFM